MNTRFAMGWLQDWPDHRDDSQAAKATPVRLSRLAWKTALIVGVVCANVSGEDLRPLGDVRFNGQIHSADEISCIGQVGDLLVIGADEAIGDDEENVIQLLKPSGNDEYQVDKTIVLSDGGEMDIEGIAVDGKFVYVMGSHSSKRKRVKANKTYDENRERLTVIDDEKKRDRVYRVELSGHDVDSSTSPIKLRDAIKSDEILGAFCEIPSKENGVDIEGLAVRSGWLYAGFRGPVLRDNYVPVMKFQFDEDNLGTELLFVNLGGRGIRAMTEVSDGFLMIAGPMGDGSASFQLYHWDGRDCIPRSDEPHKQGVCLLLGGIPVPPETKAEGIVLLKEENDRYEVLIVFDGADRGGARRFEA